MIDETKSKDGIRTAIIEHCEEHQIFIDDLCEAEKLLEQDDSQHMRRQYLRALFAYFEGVIWLFKQLCSQIIQTESLSNIDMVHVGLLNDLQFRLKENGIVSDQKAKISFRSNVKFTAQMMNRILETGVSIDHSSSGWKAFDQSINKRDQITHPHGTADLHITDENIVHMKSAFTWFSVQFQAEFLKASLNKIKSNQCVEAIVTTPVESGKVQGTQPHA